MIDVKDFYSELIRNNVDFFTGVPDSLLKDICAYISTIATAERNIITANEGAAIALGVGYHLATNKIPLIYMQNSGIGNAVNPLMSLADNEVYAVPLLLMIGWRGEPGIKDEPQHVKQGRITPAILESMEIPYKILDAESNYKKIVREQIKLAFVTSRPVALLVRKNTFSNFALVLDKPFNNELSREDALKFVLESIPSDAVIVSTTGKLSRELFELREKNLTSHDKDFLTVGSMGHTIQIALGIALSKPNLQVYCLDGDGSSIMHLGSYAIAGNIASKNLKVIVFNNGAHDSVGGQPTIGETLNFDCLAKVLNFDSFGTVSSAEDIKDSVTKMQKSNNTAFLEIKITKGARKNLGRPTSSPIDNKKIFMRYINSNGSLKF